MLIDNKKAHSHGDGPEFITAWDFLKHHINGKRNGKFDIVTGYFTIGALAELSELVKDSGDKIRIVSSEMVKGKDDTAEHTVDLLNGDLNIGAVFHQQANARRAKEFLLSDNVDVRAFTKAFCHAKAYMFQQKEGNNFFCCHLTGSNNLTEAGLGLRASSNIELALASSACESSNDFNDLRGWFDVDIWPKADTQVPDPDEPRSSHRRAKISVKEYFLRLIDNYYKEYTPEQIYYKILFELFNTEIGINASLENERDMGLLRNSVIWNTLYPYQQQGVISLVKMLRRHNGAILADAVGLGKTFSALAVIKYFQTQGYKVVLLCPKKLEQNWAQYLRHRGSRFENDAFDYAVRFHTDLQNDRLSTAYQDFHPDFLASQPKVLYVIDESHNLRNSKSNRYKELMDSLIHPVNASEADARDVKVLLLSATPINNGFYDIYGQFNIIGKGDDCAFNNEEFGIPYLKNLFQNIQKEYKSWCDEPNRTISSFLGKIKPEFFNLTDKLLVARTRKIIEQSLDIDLKFPKKDPPRNIYVSLEHFGMLHSATDIYDTFADLHLTAYQPSLYMKALPAPDDPEAPKLQWDDNVFRERFLVKMMGILLLKRLESSWLACKLTVDKILEIHEQTLEKVKRFVEQGGASTISVPVGDGIDDEEDNTQLDEEFSLRGGEINLRKMVNIEGFMHDLKEDVEKLTLLSFNMLRFEKEYRQGRQKDEKLDRLVEILEEKKALPNKKVVIFTAYADTAAYLFDELRARGFDHMAMASGSEVRTTGGHSTTNFSEILQSFAPYSKLFMERQWDDLYRRAGLNRNELYDSVRKRWSVTYDTWLECLSRTNDNAKRLVDDKIDILIATDCLSEGQNLQDADMQINYDIHWNPVRLIQRFGRIDRIGSPNAKICSVNFWPSESVDSYLKLESRIQNRMSIMNLAGTETIELNERYRQMVADNPIQDINADKLLRQLSENSVADIENDEDGENGGQTLALSDFSLEVFRQDLIDYFERNKDEFRCMPCGIFSGFSLGGSDSQGGSSVNVPESLVAVLGYPKRDPADKGKTPYQQVRIICQPVGGQPQSLTLNKPDILGLLRANRKKPRQVPLWIDHPDAASRDKMQQLQDALKTFFQQNIQAETHNNLMQLFGRGKSAASNAAPQPDGQRVEDRFQPENYDLVVWEYISRV